MRSRLSTLAFGASVGYAAAALGAVARQAYRDAAEGSGCNKADNAFQGFCRTCVFLVFGAMPQRKLGAHKKISAWHVGCVLRPLQRV